MDLGRLGIWSGEFWRDRAAVRERFAEHFRAGASHVCIQVLTAEPAVLPIREWRALAPAQ